MIGLYLYLFAMSIYLYTTSVQVRIFDDADGLRRKNMSCLRKLWEIRRKGYTGI